MMVVLGLAQTGCAYRLARWTMPSQQRLKIVGSSDYAYVVRLRIHDPRDYRVAADGRITLDAPGDHGECSVYLFDVIRVQRGVDPLTAKRFEIVRGGKIVGKLSLKEIGELPVDAEGYHLLTFNE
jgi:hypothetical protein